MNTGQYDGPFTPLDGRRSDAFKGCIPEAAMTICIDLATVWVMSTRAPACTEDQEAHHLLIWPNSGSIEVLLPTGV